MIRTSVIIPCYNPGAYLLDALESIAAQTRAPYEVIAVNDGSAAGSAAIFAEAQRRFPQVTWVNLPVNRGVSHARNAGIATAKGNCIAFLDQDDLWQPRKLEMQEAFLLANPQHHFVTARQRYFLSDGLTEAPGWLRPEQFNTDLPGFLPGTLLARAECFRRLGGFDESLRAGTDDVDWFFRAQAAGLCMHELPECLLLKRIHRRNLSTQAQAHNKELLAVVRRNLQRRKQPRVSVVIPCYNARAYIAEAIASVRAQGDIIGEIIVVDDASTDDSARCVEALDVTALRLHRLRQNRGIGAARNAGASLASHEFLAFLDADDLWPAGRTQSLMDAMESESAPWAFGSIEHFSHMEKYALPLAQTGYFAGAMLARTEFVRQVGPFDENLKVGEFIDWFDRARVFSHSPAIVQATVLRRRVHGENSSIVMGNRHVADYLKVARAAIARKKQPG